MLILGGLIGVLGTILGFGTHGNPTLIGLILSGIMALFEVFGAALPIIIMIILCIVLIRYTVFKG